ncbi:phage tail protein [Chitinophaga lutea]|uniref:Phage tail protein n=1 Tax=Chitinophaga lutea TaxID=2488634 RepID=A0A3N4Q1K3_9BACT|nr:tail fiber protein [Chitinophaga lutea]RPE05644.1 phage tail protein [Chitinophaga lutea]
MESYLAMIMIFGGNFAIRGWSTCWGQIVSIAQNTALFSLLGTTYGGNGQTTFALPDLRGRMPIGWGQGPGLPNYELGQIGGSPSTTLTINNMPMHNHVADFSTLTVTQSASTAQGTTNIPGSTLVPAALPVIGSGPSASAIKGYGVKDNTATLSPATIGGGINIGIAGGSQPFSIESPYLGVNYLIAMEGIFPPRN